MQGIKLFLNIDAEEWVVDIHERMDGKACDESQLIWELLGRLDDIAEV